MAEEAKWYVVHTYSGYENAVAAAIVKAAENRRMQDLIQEVNIPLETVTEVTDNGPKEIERKVFPGYVLVKMILTDDSWHLVRNVRGATGFVGSDGKAIPLTDEEILALGVERREIVVGFAVGDTVKITDGPLAGFNGTVEELEAEKNRWKILNGAGRDRAFQVYIIISCGYGHTPVKAHSRSCYFLSKLLKKIPQRSLVV